MGEHGKGVFAMFILMHSPDLSLAIRSAYPENSDVPIPISQIVMIGGASTHFPCSPLPAGAHPHECVLLAGRLDHRSVQLMHT